MGVEGTGRTILVARFVGAGKPTRVDGYDARVASTCSVTRTEVFALGVAYNCSCLETSSSLKASTDALTR